MKNFESYYSCFNIKNVKALFVAFLLIFISHFVYTNLNIIFQHNNIEISDIINDIDSEQENNEELEELDEFLASNKNDFLFSSINSDSEKYKNHLILNQYFEVDSPPPIC